MGAKEENLSKYYIEMWERQLIWNKKYGLERQAKRNGGSIN